MLTVEYGAYAVRDIIVDYIKENGYPPTIQEMADAMNYTISGMYPMLRKAHEIGILDIRKGSRCIRVPGYRFVSEEEVINEA